MTEKSGNHFDIFFREIAHDGQFCFCHNVLERRLLQRRQKASVCKTGVTSGKNVLDCTGLVSFCLFFFLPINHKFIILKLELFILVSLFYFIFKFA